MCAARDEKWKRRGEKTHGRTTDDDDNKSRRLYFVFFVFFFLFATEIFIQNDDDSCYGSVAVAVIARETISVRS